MTPYIEAKKAEVREIVRKYVKRDELDQAYLVGLPSELVRDFDNFADTLLGEIESRVRVRVTPEKSDALRELGVLNGYLRRDMEVDEAFQHLRTGVENITS